MKNLRKLQLSFFVTIILYLIFELATFPVSIKIRKLIIRLHDSPMALLLSFSIVLIYFLVMMIIPLVIPFILGYLYKKKNKKILLFPLILSLVYMIFIIFFDKKELLLLIVHNIIFTIGIGMNNFNENQVRKMYSAIKIFFLFAFQIIAVQILGVIICISIYLIMVGLISFKIIIFVTIIIMGIINYFLGKSCTKIFDEKELKIINIISIINITVILLTYIVGIISEGFFEFYISDYVLPIYNFVYLLWIWNFEQNWLRIIILFLVPLVYTCFFKGLQKNKKIIEKDKELKK